MCVQSQPNSIQQLWRPLCPFRLDLGVFAMLTGYIDESYTGESEPVTFGLNCVYATYQSWFWIESGWNKVIEAKNKQLEKAGRKPVRRYHSKEISNFENEFKDWDDTERAEFTNSLLVHGINGNFIQSVGLIANLKEIATDWPKVKRDGVMRFGYSAMLRMIMRKIELMIPAQFGPGARIILINERCSFDGVLLKAFNHHLNERPNAAKLFASISPMGWEDCIPLQPADFLAYEAMKEAHRYRTDGTPRKRRKSLTAFLGLESVGAVCDEIPRAAILKWKEEFEVLDRKRGMNLDDFTVRG